MASERESRSGVSWQTAAVEMTAYAAAGLGVTFIGLFLFTALSRVSFPFDLEWGEGLFVDHVARLVRGQEVYVAPSMNFTPLVYTPGYYYLASIAAHLFGTGVATLRAVSITCALGLLAVLFECGRREFGSTRDGLMVSGLFASCYAISGAWLDIARVDALLLLLIFGACYVIRFHESASALVIGGVLLAAAVMTKQVALTIAPPLLLYGFCRHRWRGLIASAAFVLTLAASVAYLQWRTDGWFLYYTFSVLSRSQSAWLPHPGLFWISDLFGRFPLATGLGLLSCALAWRFSQWPDRAFYVVVGLGLIASTWEARVHPGAWSNTLMPAYAFLSIGAVAMARTINGWVPGVGSALIALQMVLLFYSPFPFIPGEDDRRAAADVMQLVRRVPGDVLMLDHAFYTTAAGKRSHAHEMSMRDVFAAHDRWSDQLRDQVRRAIEAEQYDVILQDSPDWFPIPLGTHYRITGGWVAREGLLKQRVGNPIHPTLVYVPKGRHVQWPPADPADGGTR